jgi:hypothetical protein
VLQPKDLNEKWAVISGQWSVKKRTGVNALTRSGQAPFAVAEVEGEDGEVADKGRRSFLRQGESQKKYNAKGTSCQRLFSE